MAEVKARKRGEKWEYRFEGAKVNGKRRQFSKSGFRTKKDALDAGRRAMLEYEGGGTAVKATESSLSDVLDLWLKQYVDVNLRPKTRASYRSAADIHIRPALGHYRVASVTPSALQDFANSFKEKGYSRQHTQNVLSVLKSALGHAVEPLRYIQANPMLHVRIPTIDKPKRRRIVLKPGEWERIIGRFPFGNKYHVPLMLGYHLGLRISEAFALTWDDIDMDSRTVEVGKQVVKVKRPGDPKALWCFAPTKTRASVRRVRIGETLHDLLKREKARQAANRLAYGEFYAGYGLHEVEDGVYELARGGDGVRLVCVDNDGFFVTTDSFKYCSRVIHHELKIQFDYHSLRHTHATILVEAGAHVKSVQTRLGHENIKTTLQTYTHDTDKMQTEAVDVFERAIAHAAK